MLEIEMKFRVADFAPIKTILAEWRARPDEAVDEADHYFNAPDRDFARTDEALRLRRIGANNRVTYKGPKQAGPTKTRTEIEVSLENGAEAADDFCRLLTHLGYSAVTIVRKKRLVYHFTTTGFPLQICLDDVENLGRFVEVEIVATEENKDQAQAVLQQMAADLGLENAERRSYLEMVLLEKERKDRS
jgi:adenylate cyclase class 2